MENKFNEEASLKLISEMIATARNNLDKGEGKYFVLWGYVVCLASVIHFILLSGSVQEGAALSSALWTIAMSIGFVMTAIFIIKGRKKEKVRTYVDGIISSIWIGFGVGAISLSILLSGKYGVFIYPSILFLYTFAMFISARVYRMKWMMISVAICVLCTLSYKFIPFLYYSLPMAVALLCGNIIPGHVLNHLAKKQDV